MLKISTLAQMRLVCKEWNEIMRKNNDIWRDVFVRTLRGIFFVSILFRFLVPLSIDNLETKV